jgi:iron(III) transport system permease protein
MPAFVMAYAYTDFLSAWGPLQLAIRALTGLESGQYWFPEIHSTWGAGLFLGLALYPYVYLLARPAFDERGASLGEAARSLGLSQTAVWWRVTWPIARPAIAAGTALALMETLADFGTVSYFAVDSFTAGIYRAWQGLGDRVGAARLAIMLLVLVGALMWIERSSRGRMRFHGRAGLTSVRTSLTGWRAWRASIWCFLPPLFGFLLPASLLLHAWLSEGAPVDPRLGVWILNTAVLASAGVLVVLPLALLGAYARRLSDSRWLRWSLVLANSGYAMPGVVLGVGLLIISGKLDRLLEPLSVWLGGGTLLAGGTTAAVVYAYCVRFFPVAFQGLESALARISPSMDQSARSLGRTPAQVLREIHWPMMRRGIAAASLLVFIDCLKELPATLVLRPFNFDTLAVVVFQFASDERLAAVRAFATLPEAPALAAANKRVGNILKKSDDGRVFHQSPLELIEQVRKTLLKEPAERELWVALAQVHAQAQAALATQLRSYGGDPEAAAALKLYGSPQFSAAAVRALLRHAGNQADAKISAFQKANKAFYDNPLTSNVPQEGIALGPVFAHPLTHDLRP